MKIWVHSLCLSLAMLPHGWAAPEADPIESEEAEEPILAEQIEEDPAVIEDGEPLEGPIQPEEGQVDTHATEEPARKWYDMQFRLRAGATYDDNIFIQERNKKSDLIYSVTPGFTFGLGDISERKKSFLSLSYDANAWFFTRHSSLNSVDHDVAIRGQWSGSKLTLGTFGRFISLTGTDREVGGRVNRKIYDAGVFANYAWSDKTTLGGELSFTKADYEDQLDTQEWVAKSWVDYQYSPITTIGLGGTLGHVDVQEGGTQTYQQLLLRLRYAATGKLDLVSSLGGELRQLPNGDSQATPVYSLGAVYTPYELLQIRLDTYRRVQPSIIAPGENTTVTGVSVGAKYRFLQRFEATVSGAYEHSQYDAASTKSPSNRTDDYFAVRAGVRYTISQQWKVGASYQFRTNDSSRENRSFNNHQVSLEASVAF